MIRAVATIALLAVFGVVVLGMMRRSVRRGPRKFKDGAIIPGDDRHTHVHDGGGHDGNGGDGGGD